jgi:hypothetical protein
LDKSGKKRMWLRKLRLNEVSLVDLGADLNAQVSVFKRGEPPQGKEVTMNDLAQLTAQMTAATANIEALRTEVTKANKDKATIEAQLTAITRERDILKAGQNGGTEDDILKAADPVVAAEIIKLRKSNAASAKLLADMADEKEVKKFVDQVRTDLGHLAIKADELGPVLKRATGTLDEADMTILTRILKAADAAVAQAMRISGLPNTLVHKGSAEAEIEKLAQEKASKDGVTFAKAYDDVLASRPDLYSRFQAERADASKMN